MKRVALGAALAAAIGCGGSGSSTPPPANVSGATNPFGVVAVGTVTPAMAKITSRVWYLASHARRLTPKAPVKLKMLEPKNLVELVRSKVREEVPAEVIRAEGHCYETLGLISKGFDYENETYAVLEEELAGLYLPDDQTMYVAIGVADDQLDETLAHELVHALQDQYFGIGKKMKYKAGASDALDALQSLAEGDATSAMIDEMIMARKGEDALAQVSAVDMDDQTPEEFFADAMKGKKPDSAIRRVPRFIALGLVAAYSDGLKFVNGLRRRGGWDAVDMAWQKPPTSTEQLMHLDKYDAQEPPIDVPVATGNALGAGWTKTYDDTFGEEDARLAFGQWMTAASAGRAAMGWGGDRVTLYETSAGDRAVGWRLVYDDEKEASESAAILEVAWTTAFGEPAKSSTAGVDVLVFGGPKVEPPKKDADKGKGKPAKEKSKTKGELPPLPDPDGSTASPPPTATSTVVATAGCRALTHAGKAVALFAGAPCDRIAAWSAENGKAP